VRVAEVGKGLRERMAAERQAFALPLQALARRAVVTCAETDSVAAAVRVMQENDVGSVIVVDARSRPSGIFTSRDLTQVAAAGGLQRPISEFMSRDLVSLPPQAFAYEAALQMTDRRIRHILVVEGERLLGVVSERDLFALQRLGLGELTMEIRLADRLDTLVGLAAQIRSLAALLVEQGTAPEPLTLFISVLNDRLTRRVIEVVRRRHDLDRIRWAWLAFGSEGRFEQTFSTDQDNGLIFEAHGSSPEQARAKLVPFARAVNESLDACGFPLCEGDIMASNPALCLTQEEWRAKMSGWLNVTSPQALLDAAICLDLRPIHGDETLAGALRDWIAERVQGHAAFLRLLAQAATQSRPALGRFGKLVATDAPGAPHTVNLKANGARIFVDAARVLALAHGLMQTNTADRLRAYREARNQPRADIDALVDAFYFIQGLRLRLQALAPEARQGGRSAAEDLANRIDPASLNAFEQAALKEALRLARRLQGRVELDFHV
jgi:CBS domain-containing protein